MLGSKSAVRKAARLSGLGKGRLSSPESEVSEPPNCTVD